METDPARVEDVSSEGVVDDANEESGRESSVQRDDVGAGADPTRVDEGAEVDPALAEAYSGDPDPVESPIADAPGAPKTEESQGAASPGLGHEGHDFQKEANESPTHTMGDAPASA